VQLPLSVLLQKFLQTDTVKSVLNETSSALAAITVLKKICDHPALLNDKAANMALADNHSRSHKGRRSAADSSDKDSDCDSLGSIIADDSDEGSVCSGGDSESDYDEEAEVGARAAKVGKQVYACMDGLDAKFANMSEGDVLDRLHRKADEDSCKTVCASWTALSIVHPSHASLLLLRGMHLCAYTKMIRSKQHQDCSKEHSECKRSDRILVCVTERHGHHMSVGVMT
jgi:SNF2 family DNA or RNA helicase